MRGKKKLLWIAAGLLALAAGLGVWQRPMEIANGYRYLREIFSAAESHSVRVAGHRIHYEVEGPANGQPVVLVHGLGGAATDWMNLAPYLTEAGFRVYMPDLVGYGRSDQPADFSYSVRDEAGIVEGFLDAVGLKQVDLGGWSMGGWIVQLVASEHPERVRRLILFDSGGLAAKPAWDTRLFTPNTPREQNEFLELLMPDPPVLPDFVARDVVRVRGRNYWMIKRALASMLSGRDATDELLPRLKMPVLIVWSDVDKIFPIGQGETMHRLIPQSELEIVSGCGHMAPMNCTDQIGPKLVEFVRQ